MTIETFSGTVSVLLAEAIYGTTPLMCFFAVRWLNSPSLLVVGQSGLSSLLALCTLAYCLCKRDRQANALFRRNLQSWGTYWKLMLRGFFHVLTPFFFGALSMAFLPPAMFGVFMATSIWLKWIIERLICVKVPTQITGAGFIGATIGVIGVGMTFFPVAYQLTMPCSNGSVPTEEFKNGSFYDLGDLAKVYPYQLSYPYVNCYTVEHVGLGGACLFMCWLSWAISKVFWPNHKYTLDPSLAHFGQNFSALIMALAIWIPMLYFDMVEMPTKDYNEGIAAVLYLGIISGWFGVLLASYLKRRRDLTNADQYLAAIPVIAYLEDCLFIRDVITTSRWIIAIEAIGILLASAGVYMSNARKERPLYNPDHYQSLLEESHSDVKPERCFTQYSEDANESIKAVFHVDRDFQYRSGIASP